MNIKIKKNIKLIPVLLDPGVHKTGFNLIILYFNTAATAYNTMRKITIMPTSQFGSIRKYFLSWMT